MGVLNYKLCSSKPPPPPPQPGVGGPICEPTYIARPLPWTALHYCHGLPCMITMECHAWLPINYMHDCHGLTCMITMDCHAWLSKTEMHVVMDCPSWNDCHGLLCLITIASTVLHVCHGLPWMLTIDNHEWLHVLSCTVNMMNMDPPPRIHSQKYWP